MSYIRSYQFLSKCSLVTIINTTGSLFLVTASESLFIDVTYDRWYRTIQNVDKILHVETSECSIILYHLKQIINQRRHKELARAIPWKVNSTLNHVSYALIQITGPFTFWFKHVFLTLTCVHFFILILGSSSFESQKMERPSISVISPTSPGALKDAPQVLPGQLSVCSFVYAVNDWR